MLACMALDDIGGRLPADSPVAALCRAVEGELPRLTHEIVAKIRAELPHYADVPLIEHGEMVQEQLRGLISGLAQTRMPSNAETEHGRLLGRRRAQEGIPVESVLGAYHIGYRQIWDALQAHAHDRDPGQAMHLLALVNVVWAWLRAMTGAAADGHGEAIRSHEQSRIALGHQLLEALYGGRAGAEQSRMLAAALAFEPDGHFQVVSAPAAAWPADQVDALRQRLRQGQGTTSATSHGTMLVILVQGRTAQATLAALRGDGVDPIAGVSLRRPGLAGAALAITDAERALAVAQRRGATVHFEVDWLTATLLPHAERLQPLLDAGSASERRHLLEAVQAFAAHGFSITASAASLHIHPNTAKYRLDRWYELSGWNPRTLDGLLRSLLCEALQSE
jgi:hypothetical protein